MKNARRARQEGSSSKRSNLESSYSLELSEDTEDGLAEGQATLNEALRRNDGAIDPEIRSALDEQFTIGGSVSMMSQDMMVDQQLVEAKAESASL